MIVILLKVIELILLILTFYTILCLEQIMVKVVLLPSPSKKTYFTAYNESPLKVMKNAFYFILKVLFVFKIFKIFSWILVMKKKWFN